MELGTLCWGHWHSNLRLFGPIGYIPPAEVEANCYAANATLDMIALLN